MEDKHYITKDEGRYLAFHYDYKQSFCHQPDVLRTDEKMVISDYHNASESEKQAILIIAKHLREFCFATEDALHNVLSQMGCSIEGLDKLLEKHVKCFTFNFFILVKYDSGVMPDDALRIYCLDHGAKHILAHYTSVDMVTWKSTDVIRGTELIVKYLSTGLFFSALSQTKGRDLASFEPLCDISIQRRLIRFSASFHLLNGFTPIFFILESVRDFDVPIQFRKKVNDQISIFLQEGHWKKYYKTEPIFVFQVESEASALQVAEIFYRRIGTKDFCIFTDEQIRKGLDRAGCYVLQDRAGKLKLMKSVYPLFWSNSKTTQENLKESVR